MASLHGLSGEAMARRRALLKGLGKGSAVVAAVVPIHTLAAPTVLGGAHLCTVSGLQSNVGSRNPPGTPTTTCMGFSPAHYSSVTEWPHYDEPIGSGNATITVEGINYIQTAAFNAVFGGAAPVTPLIDVLVNSPLSDEAAWVTALLNGISQPGGFNFPYTGDQVVAFYKNPDPAVRSQALTFFKTYMQQVA